MKQTIASESLPHTSKFDVFGPKPQCQTDRKFTRLLAVLVTNHFAGSWHRLSAAEPSKDPSAAASSGQLGISCKVLVGAKPVFCKNRFQFLVDVLPGGLSGCSRLSSASSIRMCGLKSRTPARHDRLRTLRRDIRWRVPQQGHRPAFELSADHRRRHQRPMRARCLRLRA